MKVIALKTVHRCRTPGKINDNGRTTTPAVIDIHVPGVVFDVGKKEFEELAAQEAVREATKVDIAAAGDAGKVPLSDNLPPAAELGLGEPQAPSGHDL